MPENLTKPKNLDEISTRLSRLNVIRISFVDEPAIPDAEFKIVKNIFNMEDISLENEKITKLLDAVSKQLDTIISQRDEDAALIRSVVADTEVSKQLVAKNVIAIDDLVEQVASIIGDNTKKSDEEEAQKLEPKKLITDVVEDSEQGLSDKEVEKFAASLKEHYELGLLDISGYGTSLQLLANS